MDTSIVPLGENALRAILEHVVELGDAAETGYLEVKSTIDLTQTSDLIKIAKFLLGTANRPVETASAHFQGHSVLILGAARGVAPGVSRDVEPHQIANRLSPYLGPSFPSYEFGRVPVGPDRDVLFVVGAPPQIGQGPFPCHKSFHGQKGQDSVTDGAIYVRAHSETRPARAGEVNSLVERALARRARPTLDLAFEAGPVHRVEGLDSIFSDLYDREEKEFTEAGLTAGHRAERLATWRAERTMKMATGQRHLLGVALSGFRISVTSRGRFLSRPELRLTFHGCTAVDHLELDDFNLESAIAPVIVHPGPVWTSGFAGHDFVPANYPVEWTSDDDGVRVTLTPESLRPDVPWVTDADDFCVVAADHSDDVRVSWTLTEEGSDTSSSGGFAIPVAPLKQGRDLFSAALQHLRGGD
ncbi:hypothetical protein [Pseudonocardia xishanensis]|uniref:DNA-binding protein n=1 Tax=Pseudonocardia xishanensis TaxID=630995 RepID=A0ABP8RV39_9PSEU